MCDKARGNRLSDSHDFYPDTFINHCVELYFISSFLGIRYCLSKQKQGSNHLCVAVSRWTKPEMENHSNSEA